MLPGPLSFWLVFSPHALRDMVFPLTDESESEFREFQPPCTHIVTYTRIATGLSRNSMGIRQDLGSSFWGLRTGESDFRARGLGFAVGLEHPVFGLQILSMSAGLRFRNAPD